MNDEQVDVVAAVEALFDPNYYRERYADIFFNPQIDPIQHYCNVGWREGRNPNNWFSTKDYLAAHPDIANAGVNPFIHYVIVRRAEASNLRQRAKGLDKPAIQSQVDLAKVDRWGILKVSGWIVSFAPLQEIKVFLDGTALGLAEYGLERLDVGSTFADYPDAGASGFLFIQELQRDIVTNEITIEIKALGGVERQMTAQLEVASVIRRRAYRDKSIRHHIDSASLSDDGVVTVEGWAIAADGIHRIEAELGTRRLSDAEIRLPRPDVGNAYPLISSARLAGFRLKHDLQKRLQGEHILTLTIRAGEESVIIRLPLMATERRRDGGIAFYIDSPRNEHGKALEPIFGDLPVVGWAVAPTGVERIEVFLDGQSCGDAYFGAKREDIRAAYPTMLDSASSGFGMSIPKSWKPGNHLVRVVVHDHSGNIAQSEFTIEAKASDDASTWLLRRKMKQAESDLHFRVLDRCGTRPHFLLFLRIEDTTPAVFAQCCVTVDALIRQVYRDWNLRILVPSDLRSAIEDRINDLVDSDERVGMAEAPKTVPEALMGFLRAGDDLGVDALLELALHAVMHPGADLFYSDDRRYDPNSKATVAFFKPDWSPDLLLSTNYIGRAWVVRGEALKGLGLQNYSEYDLVLRLAERATVHHISKLLFMLSRHEPATAERHSLRSALRRRGIKATISQGCIPHSYRVSPRLRTTGLVSIIIPTIAAKGLIKLAVKTIREQTSYRNFEIICIDGTKDPEWKAWIKQRADKVVKAPRKFNWSRCNNLGVAASSGEYLAFLNDDIEIVDPEWLSTLLAIAQEPDVGVVGPLLVYPEGKVQHAGLVLMQSGGKHIFRFADANDPGPFGLIQTQRNVIGVTGACMMMSRANFDAIGGFDEAHNVINNDMDYCLRAWKRGYRVVYTPHTRLVHYEESSRASLPDDFDATRFLDVWQRRFALGDPFLNPSIARANDGYVPETEPTRILHVGHPLIAAQAVRRILIVKLDHIGDFITAIPAIERLKQHFPQAEITALVGKSSVALAKITPAIDHVIDFAFFHVRSGKGQRRVTTRMLEELRERLAPMRFDIAIDLRQQMDTRHVLKHTGATWLAGYNLRGVAPWLDIALELVIDERLMPKRTHVSGSLMHLVEAVAVACGSERQVFRGASQAEARHALSEHPALAPICDRLFSTPLVCLHSGVGAAIRQWPEEHFAALADLFIEGEGSNVLLIGSPDEAEVANKVLRAVRHRQSIFSLIGKTGIAELPSVLQASDLFVGNNSGPHHLAAGLGVPTIGVHSGAVDATEWGPLGPNAVALSRDMNCRPCYLELIKDCHRGHACMRGLLPREVYDVGKRLLKLRYPEC